MKISRGDIVVMTYEDTALEDLARGVGRFVGVVLRGGDGDTSLVKFRLRMMRCGFSIEEQPTSRLVVIGSLSQHGITLPHDYQEESWE